VFLDFFGDTEIQRDRETERQRDRETERQRKMDGRDRGGRERQRETERQRKMDGRDRGGRERQRERDSLVIHKNKQKNSTTERVNIAFIIGPHCYCTGTQCIENISNQY